MDEIKYIHKINLSLISLKYFCSKEKKFENIDDLENVKWETSK